MFDSGEISEGLKKRSLNKLLVTRIRLQFLHGDQKVNHKLSLPSYNTAFKSPSPVISHTHTQTRLTLQTQSDNPDEVSFPCCQ